MPIPERDKTDIYGNTHLTDVVPVDYGQQSYEAYNQEASKDAAELPAVNAAERGLGRLGLGLSEPANAAAYEQMKEEKVSDARIADSSPIATTPATPATGSGAAYASSIADMLEKPLTADEIERRRRGAAAANAIGNLGAVLSAFGNLAFTGQGAPSQTIPDYQAVDNDTWEDRQRARQLQYANTANQDRRQRIADMYQQEQNKRAEEQAAIARQNAELQRKNAEWSQQRQERMDDEARQQREWQNAYQEKAQQQQEENARAGRALQWANLAETKRYHDEAIAQKDRQLSAKLTGRYDANKKIGIYADASGQEWSLDLNKADAGTIAGMYALIFGTQPYGDTNEQKTRIATALQGERGSEYATMLNNAYHDTFTKVEQQHTDNASNNAIWVSDRSGTTAAWLNNE